MSPNRKRNIFYIFEPTFLHSKYVSNFSIHVGEFLILVEISRDILNTWIESFYELQAPFFLSIFLRRNTCNDNIEYSSINLKM